MSISRIDRRFLSRIGMGLCLLMALCLGFSSAQAVNLQGESNPSLNQSHYWYGQISGLMFNQDDNNARGGTQVLDPDQGYEQGVGISGAIGLELTHAFDFPFDKVGVRIEGEAAHRSNNFEQWLADPGRHGIDSTALMMNGYVDVPTGTRLVPYGGAGLGIAFLDDGDVAESAFAYQAMLGVTFQVNEEAALFGGYRYFATSTADFALSNGPASLEYTTHNAEAGMRVKF